MLKMAEKPVKWAFPPCCLHFVNFAEIDITNSLNALKITVLRHFGTFKMTMITFYLCNTNKFQHLNLFDITENGGYNMQSTPIMIKDGGA